MGGVEVGVYLTARDAGVLFGAGPVPGGGRSILRCAKPILAALVAAFVRELHAQSITCLGTLPGTAASNESYANAVSDDGRVVVGDCYQFGVWPPNELTLAFRWTPELGMRSLGDPPNGYGRAYDVSADGSVVVGSWGNRAYRWTAPADMELVGPSGADATAAWSVSADGSTLVGTAWSYTANDAGSYGFKVGFAGSSDVEQVPAPSGCVSEGAIEVSADGSVIAGESSCGTYRWSRSEGAEDLDPAPPGFEWVYAMSADGSVIVGDSDAFGGIFLWTADVGMTSIGLPPPGGCGLHPRALSGDGRIMVGFSDFGSCDPTGGGIEDRGFIWREGVGIEWLDEYLVRHGVDLSGWQQIGEVGGISDNGRFIVGSGIFNGETRAFLIDRFGHCRADVSRDGRVDGADLGILLTEWGPASPATVSDLDQSGTVEGADLGELLSNWGSCPN